MGTGNWPGHAANGFRWPVVTAVGSGVRLSKPVSVAS